jgi:hypothetical protein
VITGICGSVKLCLPCLFAAISAPSLLFLDSMRTKQRKMRTLQKRRNDYNEENDCLAQETAQPKKASP